MAIIHLNNGTLRGPEACPRCWSAENDSEAGVWKISTVLAQEKSSHREAPKSRNVCDADRCGAPREGSAILQATRLSRQAARHAPLRRLSARSHPDERQDAGAQGVLRERWLLGRPHVALQRERRVQRSFIVADVAG